MILCDFRRVITISDEIDMGPLETLTQEKINQCHDMGNAWVSP